MTKPTLLVLAAGMGSRYGGLKQLDGVGPSGETIMDYSVYDALRAGFGKVVFVIRHDFEDDFREKVLSKYEKHIPVEVVFQSVDALPEGFTAPAERTKPWGTNHAVLMGAPVVREPFAVINADDFYGRESFHNLAEYLSEPHGKGEYCMIGFRLGNTLSEGGAVSRGVCSVDAQGRLTGVTERTSIERRDGKTSYAMPDGSLHPVDEASVVSMNMWGFTPDYFDFSEQYFVDFLRKHINEAKGEFYIPSVVNGLIVSGEARVQVLGTSSEWFGVTYPRDRDTVVARLSELVAAGDYPVSLWK